MKTKFLFPSNFKPWGWVLLLTGLVAGIWYRAYGSDLNFFDVHVISYNLTGAGGKSQLFYVEKDNIFNEILGILIIAGSLLVSFSQEKDEDEFIMKMRLESLVWAIYWNYGLLTLAIIFVYGMDFLDIMVYHLFTPLILFVIRFNWLLWRSRKSVKNEE